MATYSSDLITNKKQIPAVNAVQARQVYCVPFQVTLSSALALNDLIKLAELPNDCVPVDFVAFLSDLDTNGTPALVWDAGILNSDGDDLVSNSKIVSGSTVGQAAGVQRMNASDCVFNYATWIADSECDGRYKNNIVAMKVTTAPATGAASGTIKGLLFYRSLETWEV